MLSVDDILCRVHQAGERMKIPRRLVIEALHQSANHVTISEIQVYLQKQGHSLDESTIYRILQWLKSLRIVSQTDLGEREIVYELLAETPHHHLICLGCHAVIGLDDSLARDLRERLQREYGFEARVDHMAIFGWCRQCSAQRQDTGI
jgi:Fur family transcriptional regulator, ferric uptake regulator